jgi:hypothetical protein
MKTGPYVWLALLALSGMPHVSAAQPGASPTLRSVEATVEGGVTVVTVAADGPLPAPVSGIAETPPPRVFFDFTGVNPLPGVAGRMIRLPGAGAVTGVRVALYSMSPTVTRVVLDLKRLEPFSVNVGDQVSGRIRIVVGSPAAITAGAPAAPKPAPSTAAPPAFTPKAAPAATLPPPAALLPPTNISPPVTVAPSGPPPPSFGRQAPKDVPSPAGPARRGGPPPEPPGVRPAQGLIESYRRQLADSLDRLESHRPVIAAVDLEQVVTTRTLEAVNAELKSIQVKLQAVKPSDEMRPTHDLLLTSCVLGANAVTLRLDAELAKDAAGRRNAASAAAGALMLYDRACAVLGCGPRR